MAETYNDLVLTHPTIIKTSKGPSETSVINLKRFYLRRQFDRHEEEGGAYGSFSGDVDKETVREAFDATMVANLDLERKKQSPQERKGN